MPSAVTVRTGSAYEPIERAIKRIHPNTQTKADKARVLLTTGGYTVSEVSKGLGMAYSQVHSINKKLALQGYRAPAQSTRTLEDHAQAIPTARQRNRARKPLPSPALTQPKPRKGIGKLRTPGHPSDIDVGPCGNCDHDLVVRRGPTGYMLVHVNVTAEEHLAVTQFCQPVPEVLLG